MKIVMLNFWLLDDSEVLADASDPSVRTLLFLLT